ncbi:MULTISPECIES: hypothetical protein [Streptomyces]|uniref:hypothetical protein n=1 Tax=Streptomyces TaxID=1883 RepID=UPI0016733063|nr:MULTISPECIES: hypothetical protein [Streptomyces]MBK3524738.1 hypothetical protein [Streptomyces sp. MBT70]GGR71661.1 hypothetical protein GCM10010236_27650 [Streptomyces eurythermus]
MRTGWIRLWRGVAWGGIGLSLYAGWLTVDDARDRSASERAIAEACDRLVSGAAVMDLHGGTVRAKTSADRIDTHGLRGSCTVYQASGSGRTRGLFSLAVRTGGKREPLNRIGAGLEPFALRTPDRTDKTDLTAVADRRPEPRPLGDGTLGWYGNWYTTVRAECGPGSSPTAPPLLHITASADYDDDVSGADRARLARIARSATETLTHRIGCRTRLPALPGGEPAPVPTVLRPARSAGGSCAWFAGYLRRSDHGPLPDRALSVPVRDTYPLESCLLAVSPGQVRHTAGGLPEDKRDYADSAVTHSPWWLRTVTYTGAEARATGYESLDGEDIVIKPGTAGQTNNVWWASSVCGGKPALHTLSSSYSYDNVLGSRAVAALFRAYVDDVAGRRGCTHVTFPDAADSGDR